MQKEQALAAKLRGIQAWYSCKTGTAAQQVNALLK